MYNSKNFSVMAYANGFTLWAYSTADTLESVKADNYFNETAPFARAGDMILVTAGTGAESVDSALMAVTKIADGVVSVTSLTGESAKPSTPTV